MSRDDFGPSLVDGELRYLSVSQVQAFDAESEGGCETAWWFDKVAKIKRPSDPSQEVGTRVHAELEQYMRTGVDALGPIARAAKRFCPTGDALVERLIAPFPEYTREGVRRRTDRFGELTSAGVPFLGYIDVEDRNDVHRDGEGGLVMDGHPEVLDWKTTGDLKWAKDPEAVASTLQMTGYGLVQGSPQVRLSHVYIRTKGRTESVKRTLVVTRERLERQWARVERIVERMRAVARMTAPSEPAKNYSACEKFRGCFYKSTCPRSPDVIMSLTFGEQYAALAAALTPKEESPMGLMDRVVKPGTPTAPAAPSPEIAAAKAKLLADEAAAKAKPADAGYTDISRDDLVETPTGLMFLIGAGADAYAKAAHITQRAADGRIRTSPQHLAHYKCRIVEPRPPAPIEPELPALEELPDLAVLEAGALPLDAPASDPAKASDPIPADVLPTLDPEIQAAHAAAHERTQSTEPEQAAPAKRGPGRPRKNAEAPPATPSGIGTSPSVPGVNPTGIGTSPSATIVYIDCLPSSTSTLQSLEAYVAETIDAVTKAVSLVDLRMAPEGHPLAFGKWKGALAARVRACPPPAGAWFLLARDDEQRNVIAGALLGLVDVVRGVR